MAHSYSWDQQWQWSRSSTVDAAVRRKLMDLIPGATAVLSGSERDDKCGVDYWVRLRDNRWIGVDVKSRSRDYRQDGKDDLALEIWSIEEAQKIGWTRDPNKQCRYVMWYWVDTGRVCLIDFLQLCAVFSQELDRWQREYPVHRQLTPDRGYHSTCIIVPTKEIWMAVGKRFMSLEFDPWE